MAGRRKRTALLAGAASLSTALVAAVSCALTSLNEGLAHRLEAAVGRADLRVREIAGDAVPPETLAQLENRPEVEVAAPRAAAPLPLRNETAGVEAVAEGRGVDPQRERLLSRAEPWKGRRVAADNEVVLDFALAEELRVDVGDTLRVARFGAPIDLTVVGVNPRQRERFNTRAAATTTLATLRAISGDQAAFREIQVALREDAVDRARAQLPPPALTPPEPARSGRGFSAPSSPEQRAQARAIQTIADDIQTALPRNVMVRPTERVTAGISGMMQANRMLFALSSTLAFCAAAFIVMTGLTTSVLERQRELAILRCIGATRTLLARAQLLVGGLIGALGAAWGVPLGVFLAWILTIVFAERLPAGLHVSWVGLLVAALGSVVAGVLGASWPAVQAARVSPLAALTSRAKVVRRRGVLAVTAFGALGVLAMLLIVGIPDDARTVFLGYTFAGLPLMFVGYFLLGVPVHALVVRAVGPVIAAILRLPRTLLVSVAAATPYRSGFTAGALMVGLAMMTSIWTNGTTILRDWLGAIEFPDAFAHNPFGLTADDQARIEALPFVSDTVPITLYKIDRDAFGIRGLHSPPTNFVAFDPEPFLSMTRLHWEAGDPAYALRRLREGGAVLVAKEFLVKREGYGVGQTFTVDHRGQSFEFEIVGAVSSPGLDLVSAYFDIGRDYADQAVSSVFGSRSDLQRVFNNDSIQLLQIGLKGDVTDAQATARIRETLGGPPVIVGSGREIKQQITQLGASTMRVASLIAVAAMLIGCGGVLNVIVAGIDARRYEFGVLRAVGAGSGLVARLVVGEVALISLTACVLGTLLGIQAVWAALRMYELLAGIVLPLRPPPLPILMGWGILLALTLGVCAPAIIGLARKRPRELLASVRG